MLAEQVALKLIDVLNEITSLGECRNFMRKEYATLSRRVKLLSPLFEEMKEIETSIPGDAIDFFDALEAALLSAKELLNFTHDGSKIFLKNDIDIDPKILGRLSKKLQLKTIADLKKESHALYMMVIERGDDDDSESLEQISKILRKLKEFTLTENLEMNEPDNENDTSCGRASIEKIIPNDFRCHISLELMKDPVIVATGQ
ncbi:hypothetical protein KI387_035369, partial [Taxus chinensis]